MAEVEVGEVTVIFNFSVNSIHTYYDNFKYLNFFLGRGGNRKTQHQQNQISAEDQLKIKMYKLKYDKYLNLKPQTNSPFDTLIKATQVMYFLYEIFHEFKTICFIFIIKSF